MKRSIFSILLLALPLFTLAQQLRPATSAQIYHELNQLKSLTNVLYLAAHPDDENTRMLAWLVNDQHIPTAYLSLTRGDGGQNILGPQLGPALGLIRTHELLEARKLDGGAGQYFTRAVDFGFSKTSDETFKHWDEERLTGDVVWVMRQFRPDVIICRFPPDERAGHGQHAASAIVGHKAFNAAGSADSFKEQFKYVKPWQPKRIFFNAYRFGDRNTTSEDQFKLDVGQYNSLLGMGYGELAGISRSIHRSQGAGTRSVPGVQTEYLALVDGEPATNSIFDGIDITWGRIGRKDIGEKIEKIIKAYDFTHPEKSLPALLALYKEVKDIPDNDWKYRKMKDLEAVILHASGFMAEIVTDKPEVTRGEMVPFSINVIARSKDVKIKLLDIKCLETDTVCYMFLPFDELVTFKRSIRIPGDASYTEPYWLSQPQTQDAFYPIPDPAQLGMPETPNELTATTRVQVGDETFLVEIPLSYKTTDPTHGDVVEQLRVVPEITLDFTSGMYLMADNGDIQTTVHIHTEKDLKGASLVVSNAVISGMVRNIDLAAGKDTTITVTIASDHTSGRPDDKEVELYASVIDGKKMYDKQQHTNKYEHLPTLQYYTQPHAKVLMKAWECKAKNIAYIEGVGDDVSEILRFAGMKVDVLKNEDITAANLAKYDAVLVGIRAINVNEQAPVWMPKLMKYVENGGTLVMQYNTNHSLNTKDIGPYQFSLSRDRVTEEDAEVTILNKEDRLLNYPNKITKADFDNWVQERGLYFADKWDEHYKPLFSMHDAGEEPSKGSTLYTKYGKGYYIYTPLSFFRQLPAGNVGAIKLLCNFLSAGK
ncbi:MAG: PIG-L family deacetylase [Chitinophagales bacterium]|nr:PIG-L family deacetylase [Chitinophagales bacterium]